MGGDNEFVQMLKNAESRKKRWYKFTAVLTEADSNRVLKFIAEITPTVELELSEE